MPVMHWISDTCL